MKPTAQQRLDDMAEQLSSIGGAAKAVAQRMDSQEVTKAEFNRRVRDGEWEAETDINRFGRVEIRVTSTGQRKSVVVKDHKADANPIPQP